MTTTMITRCYSNASISPHSTLSQIALPWGDQCFHLIHGSLAPPSPQPNGQLGTLIGSAVFAGLINVSNRHTDRPRYICSNRPHLMLCIVIRPNNNMEAQATQCLTVTQDIQKLTATADQLTNNNIRVRTDLGSDSESTADPL